MDMHNYLWSEEELHVVFVVLTYTSLVCSATNLRSYPMEVCALCI